jgi:hypothetical protein
LSCVHLIDDLISISLPFQPQVSPPEGDQDGADMDFVNDDYYHTEGTSSNEVEMTPNDEGPSSSDIQGSWYREDFTGASGVYGTGKSFMGNFDSDSFAEQRKENLYYPFASKVDWEMASFLLRSRMSMAMINDFLKLGHVSTSLQLENPEKI